MVLRFQSLPPRTHRLVEETGLLSCLQHNVMSTCVEVWTGLGGREGRKRDTLQEPAGMLLREKSVLRLSSDRQMEVFQMEKKEGKGMCEGTCGTGSGVGVGHEGGRRLKRSGWW